MLAGCGSHCFTTTWNSSTIPRKISQICLLSIIMAAPVVPCDDSITMLALSGFAPLCTDLLNAPPGHANGPRWAQKQCTDCAKGGPAATQHMVCGACYEFARELEDNVYQEIVSMSPIGQPSGAPFLVPGPGVPIRGTIGTPAWPAIPPPGAVRFRGFWTRLCVPWYVFTPLGTWLQR